MFTKDLHFDQTLMGIHSEDSLDIASKYIRELHRTIRDLSRKWPLDPSTAVVHQHVPEWMYGRTVKRAIVIVPPIYGCEYRQLASGCLECGEDPGLGIKPNLALAVNPLQQLTIRWLVNPDESPEWVCWYVEGSNLNYKEIPKDALRIALLLIADIPTVKRITIESRPEFVTEEVLDILEDIAVNYKIEIEIGIGVEVYDDFIRQYCINKGETFTWKSFIRTAEMIKNRRGLRILTYVLLKPPFLTEKEAIDEAIRTIKECFRAGVDAISLEIMGIHEFTFVEYLWLKNLYRPPWLWSAIKTVMETYNLGEVRIGGEPKTYFPASKRAAYNCERCTRKGWKKAIRKYNETHDVEVLTQFSCECKEEWNLIVKNKPTRTPVYEKIRRRIIEYVKDLSLEDYKILKLHTLVREALEKVVS